LDASHFLARFKAHDETAEIDYVTDEKGRPLSVNMPRWGNPEGAEFHSANCGGLVEKSATFGGYTIAVRMRVGWHFGTERFESEGEFFRVTRNRFSTDSGSESAAMNVLERSRRSSLVNKDRNTNRIMQTNTIRLHRVLRTPPERIYRALLDADAMAKWLPPNGFTGKVHDLDAKVGGTYKMSFTNFTTGKSHSFGGTYLELTPHERIRYTNKFDAPNLPGEMQTTITLKQVFCGTELNITQEGIPAAIPAEACYLGWQESLMLLAKLVEAEIPDQP
jgi:uncharacterized protein YndB with AHSA1/START domain